MGVEKTQIVMDFCTGDTEGNATCDSLRAMQGWDVPLLEK